MIGRAPSGQAGRQSRSQSALSPPYGDHPSREPRVWNVRKKNAPLTVVYVGRGTPWGNPFVVGVDGDREEVCDRFEREILPTLDVRPLIGHDLLCWCSPLRCHADALLRKANAIAMEAASAGETPERLDPKDDSAGPKDIAQGQSHDQ